MLVRCAATSGGGRSSGFFVWLGNFRRLVVRYERHALNYLGFVRPGYILIILLRQHAKAASWDKGRVY